MQVGEPGSPESLELGDQGLGSIDRLDPMKLNGYCTSRWINSHARFAFLSASLPVFLRRCPSWLPIQLFQVVGPVKRLEVGTSFFFLLSILVEPCPRKRNGKRALLRDLARVEHDEH